MPGRRSSPVHATEPAAFAARRDALLPHLGLIVSGGNTLLFEIDRARRISVLSSTRDDAAGEALDKGAKLLGLGYPGGPLIEQRAAAGRPDAFAFPRGIRPNGRAVIQLLRAEDEPALPRGEDEPDEVAARRDDLCASYQQAVIDALVRRPAPRSTAGRLSRACGLSGGVANNAALRAALAARAREKGIRSCAARPEHTGDNAGNDRLRGVGGPCGARRTARAAGLRIGSRAWECRGRAPAGYL